MAARSSSGLVPRVRSSLVPSGGSSRPKTLSAYLRDFATPFLFSFRPAIRDPIDDTAEAWVSAASKAIETVHNSGWIAGGTDTAVKQMIGVGLDLNLKPDDGIFGNADETEAWARAVQRKWEAYADDPWSCDAGGRYTMGQLASQIGHQYFPTGEGLATLPIIIREGSTHATKVRVLPSTRLSQTSAMFPGAIQGVVQDRNHAPAGYIIQERDHLTSAVTERLISARDERGRPTVIHLMDAAPSAVRGITPFAPVLKVVRQYDQLADATLTAALVQAIFAASIESDSPTPEIMKALQSEEEQEDEMMTGGFDNYMSKRFEWYGKSKIDLGQHGKIVHTFPGEGLKFHRSEHPNENYLDFSKNLLREIARCLGITYEQLTGDYVGATYSSVRMAIADMWLINLYRRAHIASRFYQIVFEAWLEEEILTGSTPMPGGIEAYYALRSSVARAYWRGPPRPTADDLKTAKAQQIQRQEGWVSTEQIASEYGNDHRDVIASQEITNQRRAAAGMAPLSAPVDLAGGGGTGFGEGSGGEGAEARRDRDRLRALAARNRDEALTAALMRDDDAEVDRLIQEEMSGV